MAVTAPGIHNPAPNTQPPSSWGDAINADLTDLDSRITQYMAQNPMADWSAYVPEWTASSTNPAIGNGTIEGRYLHIGKTLFCRIAITAGTTTTFGSGTYRFHLPSGLTTAAHNQIPGTARVRDNSPFTVYPCVAVTSPGLNYVVLSVTDSPGPTVTHAVPVATPASGDEWLINIVVEVNESGGGSAGVSGIPHSIADAKGDILIATGPDTFARKAVGPNGAVLMADSADSSGAIWSSDVSRAIDRTTADLDYVNSTTETTIYSVSVPAGSMGTDRAVRLIITGDYFNNSGATRTIQLKVKFGGTTVYDDLTSALAVSTARRSFFMEVIIQNQAASNAQIGGGQILIGPVGAATSGVGELGAVAGTANPITLAASTIDTAAAARTLEVTAIHSLANTSLSLRRLTAMAVLL